MKNINDYVVSIQENMEKKIEKIRGIEYHYELESLIKDLNGLQDNEKDIVLESLLNKYLELLKPIYTKEKFKEVATKFTLRGGGNPAMAQGGGEYSSEILVELQKMVDEFNH